MALCSQDDHGRAVRTVGVFHCRPTPPNPRNSYNPGDANDVATRPRTPLVSVRGHKRGDRKSTRLNSSHVRISYAVFCLKKKKNTKIQRLSTQELTDPASRNFRDSGLTP